MKAIVLDFTQRRVYELEPSAFALLVAEREAQGVVYGTGPIPPPGEPSSPR